MGFMTFIESSGFLMSLGFAVLSILSIGSFMYRDVQLLLRKGIRYHNYGKKESYFRLQPTEFHLNVYRLLVVIGIIISIVYLFTNMVRIYLIVLLPLIMLMVFFYLQEQKIQDTNLSLHKFDIYYEEIHTLIEKKTFLLNEIKMLNQGLSDKHVRFLGHIETMNQFLHDKLDRSYYLKITNPIKSKIDQYERDLNRYDNSISQKFNDLLKSYLKTLKISKGLEVPALVNFVPKDIELEIQSTEALLIDKIYLDSQQWLASNMENDESPVKMLKALEAFQKDLDELIKQSFAYYHESQNRQPWFFYLEEKKLYKIEFLTQHKYLKLYPWIFSNRLYQNIKTEQALALMQYLIKEDYHDSGLTMMLTLPLIFRDLLPRVLNPETIQNRTSKLFQVFVDVFAQTLEFYQPTTILFDQLMALQHYVEFEVPDPSNLNRIESILNRNELEMEKAWIQTAYQDNLTALVNMKNKAIELLIIVQDVVGSSHPWYDFGTLVGLIHEYQKTLQKEKLSMLLVMLFLMICLKSQSPQIYEKAYGIVEQELNQLINFPQKGQSQQSIIIRIQDALKRDGYFHQAAAIMARIEQQRQMIDEVLEQKVA
jgi:hypothetical protein